MVTTRYSSHMSPMLSTCPLHTISGCWQREAHITWYIVTCKGSTRYWNYHADYWPFCAGGLLAVNAIGLQLRSDPINSGLILWRMSVCRTGRSNPSRETKFSGGNGDKKNKLISSVVQLTTSRTGNLTRLTHTLLRTKEFYTGARRTKTCVAPRHVGASSDFILFFRTSSVGGGGSAA